MGNQIIKSPSTGLEVTEIHPTIISNAGNAVGFAYDEFIYGAISNQHMRRAYCRAVDKFFGIPGPVFFNTL